MSHSMSKKVLISLKRKFLNNCKLLTLGILILNCPLKSLRMMKQAYTQNWFLVEHRSTQNLVSLLRDLSLRMSVWKLLLLEIWHQVWISDLHLISIYLTSLLLIQTVLWNLQWQSQSCLMTKYFKTLCLSLMGQMSLQRLKRIGTKGTPSNWKLWIEDL